MISGIILTFLLGCLTVIIFLPEITCKLLKISLSFATGIIINSVLTFAVICLRLPKQEIILPIVELILILYLIFIAKKRKILLSNEKVRENTLLKIFHSITFVCCLILLLLHFYKDLYGSWDGIFIWNLHSKFLYTLYQSGESFKILFNPAINWSHIDYPMLLPCFNYRLHLFSNSYNFINPIVTGIIFYISVVFALAGGIKLLTNTRNGLIAGMILMTIPVFLYESGAQCADVPLSFFILLTFIMLFLYEKFQNKNYLLFTGLFAAASAFTKNEGILFLLVFSFLYFYTNKNHDKKPYLNGILIPALCVLYSKIFLSSQNDIFYQMTIGDILSRLTDFSRYKTVFLYYFTNIIKNIPWIVCLLSAYFTGTRTKYSKNTNKIMLILCLLIIFIAYTMVYLITPRDLSWHLETSSFRLIVQYISLVIFFVFINFNCCDKS